jgi:hypothetical protein
MHSPAKTLGDEPRHPAAVVEVRVCQQHRIDALRPQRQGLAVAQAQLLQPLE